MVKAMHKKSVDSKTIVYQTLSLSPKGLTLNDIINETGLGKRNIRRILMDIEVKGNLIKGLAGWDDMRKIRYKLRA